MEIDRYPRMFPERASNFAVDPAWANMGLQCYTCGILLRHRLLRVDYYHDDLASRFSPAFLGYEVISPSAVISPPSSMRASESVPPTHIYVPLPVRAYLSFPNCLPNWCRENISAYGRSSIAPAFIPGHHDKPPASSNPCQKASIAHTKSQTPISPSTSGFLCKLETAERWHRI
ncbi:hypothetical protein C8J57DRAFT_1307371 [Mycena rebaudengoi]|nr:hypothetical protein C8J57DRAFT_1307371 [Mycena rebaudengoi]